MGERPAMRCAARRGSNHPNHPAKSPAVHNNPNHPNHPATTGLDILKHVNLHPNSVQTAVVAAYQPGLVQMASFKKPD